MKRIIASFILFIFISNSVPLSYGQAQIFGSGAGVGVSSVILQPAMTRGMTIYPNEPFRFDFFIDEGDASFAAENSFKEESEKLIKYFMAGLAIPQKDLWVNLNPEQPDRIVPAGLDQTVLGRDMLAADYLLKQLTASLLSPESEEGEKFWDAIYGSISGTDTRLGAECLSQVLSRVWITPDVAQVYVHENPSTDSAGSGQVNVFVSEARLRVLWEENYQSNKVTKSQSDNKNSPRQGSVTRAQRAQASDVTLSLMQQVILPAIEKEVNENPAFAQLRQIYHVLILAEWYKRNLRQSILGQAYVDQKQVQGIAEVTDEAKQKIYQDYLAAFQKNANSLIKEEYDPQTQQIIPRQYIVGGVDVDMAVLRESSDFAGDKMMERLNQPLSRVEFLIGTDNPSEAEEVMSVLPKEAFPNGGKAVLSTGMVITSDDVNPETTNKYRNLIRVLDQFSDEETILSELIIPGIEKISQYLDEQFDFDIPAITLFPMTQNNMIKIGSRSLATARIGTIESGEMVIQIIFDWERMRTLKSRHFFNVLLHEIIAVLESSTFFVRINAGMDIDFNNFVNITAFNEGVANYVSRSPYVMGHGGLVLAPEWERLPGNIEREGDGRDGLLVTQNVHVLGFFVLYLLDQINPSLTGKYIEQFWPACFVRMRIDGLINVKEILYEDYKTLVEFSGNEPHPKSSFMPVVLKSQEEEGFGAESNQRKNLQAINADAAMLQPPREKVEILGVQEESTGIFRWIDELSPSVPRFIRTGGGEDLVAQTALGKIQLLVPERFEKIRQDPQGRILLIGTGRNERELEDVLRAFPQSQIDVVDVLCPELELLRKYIERNEYLQTQKSRVRLHWANAADLPKNYFRDEIFDIVLGFGVDISMEVGRNGILREMLRNIVIEGLRVLKPDGILMRQDMFEDAEDVLMSRIRGGQIKVYSSEEHYFFDPLAFVGKCVYEEVFSQKLEYGYVGRSHPSRNLLMGTIGDRIGTLEIQDITLHDDSTAQNSFLSALEKAGVFQGGQYSHAKKMIKYAIVNAVNSMFRYYDRNPVEAFPGQRFAITRKIFREGRDIKIIVDDSGKGISPEVMQGWCLNHFRNPSKKQKLFEDDYIGGWKKLLFLAEDLGWEIRYVSFYEGKPYTFYQSSDGKRSFLKTMSGHGHGGIFELIIPGAAVQENMTAPGGIDFDLSRMHIGQNASNTASSFMSEVPVSFDAAQIGTLYPVIIQIRPVSASDLSVLLGM